jgi:hypothetical protein
MSIFHLYKEANELVHGDDLDNLDAPVKVITEDGRELFVTSLELETNPETGEQVVWAKAVEE